MHITGYKFSQVSPDLWMDTSFSWFQSCKVLEIKCL